MVKSSKKALAVLLAVACLITFMPAMASQSFAAKKLTVKPAKKTIYVKKSFTLKANQKVKWSASKSSLKVVKLTSKKAKSVKVTGKKAGKAVVTAKVGKQTKRVTIKVKKAPVKKPVAKAAPTIDTSKVQTLYGLATEYNKVASSITQADLLKGVTAKDASGNDVTVSIASIKEVDSTGDSINAYNNIPLVKVNNLEKHFEVTYTATDASGKTATKTVVVTVKNLDPVVVASNFSYAIKADNTGNTSVNDEDLIKKGIVSVDDYESYPATTKAEDKTAAAFQAAAKGNTIEITKITDAAGNALGTTDKVTGKTTADPSKIVLNKAGTYTITYKVTDYLGASVEKTVTMTVGNNQAPTIATTEATVYANSTTQEADVRDQIRINDAEDGQNVKPNNKDTEIKFIDANGNEVKTSDANFFKKVVKAYVVNVKDSNDAYAQTKLIDIKVAEGLVLTAKDQVVDLDINAPATTTVDPMQYITATLNGAAYTLDNPATTTNGNTTVTVDGAVNGTISAKTAGKHTVKYDVTAKVDGKTLTATKTITVTVANQAKDAADKVAGQIAKATKAVSDASSKETKDYTEAKKLVSAARTAYDALSDAAKALVTNYSDLQNAEKTIADAEKTANDNAQANGVENKINAIADAKTTEAYATAVNAANEAYASLTNDQKAIVDKAICIESDGTTYKAELEKFNKILEKTQAAKIEVTGTTDDHGALTFAKVVVTGFDATTKLNYSWMGLNEAGKWVTLERQSATTNYLDAKDLKTAGYTQVKVAVSGSGVAGTLYSDAVNL